MHFKRSLGLAVLVVGIVLFAFGVNSTRKVNERFVEAVEGRYTHTTMWYLIGGIALIAMGSGLMITRRRP